MIKVATLCSLIETLRRKRKHSKKTACAQIRTQDSCYKKGTLQHRVENITRGTLIGSAIDSAETSAARRTGLLKHSSLDEGGGLWIVPCESVHTFFMKFPIDLVYLDRQHRVRSVVRGLVPWRISACLAAHSILELPIGTVDRTNTQRGDQIVFEASAPDAIPSLRFETSQPSP